MPRPEPATLVSEIQKALTQWVNSLPFSEAERMVICVSGKGYSPKQILNDVETGTDFGREFVKGLSDLHYWMAELQPGSSVINFIRRSTPKVLINPRALAYEKNLDSVEREIGTVAGAVLKVLQSQPEISLANLQEALPMEQPFLDWAIGWLAREENITVALAAEQQGTQEQIGTTAGIIWRALEARGELFLAVLQQEVAVDQPLFSWAIGWLAREGKLTITYERNLFSIYLKTKAPSA